MRTILAAIGGGLTLAVLLLAAFLLVGYLVDQRMAALELRMEELEARIRKTEAGMQSAVKVVLETTKTVLQQRLDDLERDREFRLSWIRSNARKNAERDRLARQKREVQAQRRLVDGIIASW